MLTTLLVLIMGIFFITAAARYYEDEKLFWKLIVPFLGTYAIGIALFSANPKETPSKQESITQTTLMQALPSALNSNEVLLANVGLATTVNVKTFVPAGSENVSEYNTFLSNLGVLTTNLTVWKEPPRLEFTYFDTS